MQQPQQPQQPQQVAYLAQPQAQVITNPNHQTIVLQQQPYAFPQQSESGCGKREKYAGRASVWLGSLKILGGILAIIFQIGLMVLQLPSAFVGVGIWCGLVYIIPGAFGIGAGKRKSLCLIIAYMVLCVTMVLFIIPVLVYTAVGLGRSNNPWECRPESHFYPEYPYTDYIDYPTQEQSGDDRFQQPKPPPRRIASDYRPSDEITESDICSQHKPVMMFMYSVLLIICLFELGLMIAGSALCCRVTCCYTGGAQQGRVLAPSGQGITIIQSPGYPGQAIGQTAIPNHPVMPPPYGTVATETQYMQPTGGHQNGKGPEVLYERPPAYNAAPDTNVTNGEPDNIYTEITN